MRWEDNAKARFFYRGREHQRAQLQAAVDRLGDPRRKTLLDVGCGYGDLIDLLPSSVRYKGIDSDEQAIKAAQELHPGKRFVCTTEATPAQIVVAVASLQCAQDPVEFARELWAVTKQTLVIVACKDAHLPEEKQGLDWIRVLPKPDVFESNDDWLAVTAHR